jgi:uncharacterized protein
MRTLKIDEIPEEGLDLEWKEDRVSLLAYLKELSRIDFDFESPLHAEVKVRKTGPTLLLTGSVDTILQLQCVRCLKEFSFPLSSTFDLLLQPVKESSLEEEKELAEEDMESGFFEGGVIHLSEIVCEQIFLEIPYQPLCNEGCKGLCQSCGKDLNLSECQCNREEVASGFSALGKLKLDR